MPDSISHEDNRCQPNDFSTRLLQLFAVQHVKVQYQQVATYSEQSSKSRHTIFMKERCMTTVQSAALASDQRQDQIQDCRHHAQSSFKFRASLFCGNSTRLRSASVVWVANLSWCNHLLGRLVPGEVSATSPLRSGTIWADNAEPATQYSV